MVRYFRLGLLVTVCLSMGLIPLGAMEGAGSAAERVEVPAQSRIDWSTVSVTDLDGLKPEEERAFVDLFVRSFGKQYEGATLEALGKAGTFATKEDWLRVTAEEELAEAKSGKIHPSFFFHPDTAAMMAYLSVSVADDGTTLYLGQGCVDPAYWGNHAAAHALREFLPTLARRIDPRVGRFELLVRRLNPRAIRIYQLLGFTFDLTTTDVRFGFDYDQTTYDEGRDVEGTNVIARKYDYPPRHYVGMFLDIPAADAPGA